MYIKRTLKMAADKAVKSFPAVLITGPRQSGKTTFLREEYLQDREYVSFDDPLQIQFAGNDPNGFLDQFGDKPVILDEVQYVPELFRYLKIRIDADRKKMNRYLMTGSQQFHLMKNISDSLAGRIAVLELLPFHGGESDLSGTDSNIEGAIWNGGYPEIVLQPGIRDMWISSYIRTYVERDVRQLQMIRNLGRFELFLALLASRHGRELNLSGLSRDIGLSVPGCKQWIDLLEASYMIYRLRPFFRNFGKRLIKTPKLYFVDSAIAAFLSRQPSPAALWHGASGGSFFEGWIIMDVLKRMTARQTMKDIYFWRSHDGLEVDLILMVNGRIIPVEIKQTSTPMPRHIDSILSFRKLAGDECSKGLLVCTVKKETILPGGVVAMPWQYFGEWIENQLP